MVDRDTLEQRLAYLEHAALIRMSGIPVSLISSDFVVLCRCVSKVSSHRSFFSMLTTAPQSAFLDHAQEEVVVAVVLQLPQELRRLQRALLLLALLQPRVVDKHAVFQPHTDGPPQASSPHQRMDGPASRTLLTSHIMDSTLYMHPSTATAPMVP